MVPYQFQNQATFKLVGAQQRLSAHLMTPLKPIQVASNLNPPRQHPLSSQPKQPRSISLSLSVAPRNLNPIKISLAQAKHQSLSPSMFRLQNEASNISNKVKKSDRLFPTEPHVLDLSHRSKQPNLIQRAKMDHIKWGTSTSGPSNPQKVTASQISARPLNAPYESQNLSSRRRRAQIETDYQAAASSTHEIRAPDGPDELATFNGLQFVAADLEPQDPSIAQQFGTRKQQPIEDFTGELQKVDDEEITSEVPILLDGYETEQTLEEPVEGVENPIYKDSYEIGSMKSNDLKTADADESAYLVAQLPSQYDSAITMPPDGYYDDYYKPGLTQKTSDNLIKSRKPINQDEPQNEDHQSNYEVYQAASAHVNQADGSENPLVEDLAGYDSDPDRRKTFTTSQATEDDDNLRVIVADTSSSQQDPNNVSEKLINYTSETGQGNATRIDGVNNSSPRLTFVNRDMNESNQSSPVYGREPELDRSKIEQGEIDTRRSSDGIEVSRISELGRGYSKVPKSGRPEGKQQVSKGGDNHKEMDNHRYQLTEVHLDPKKLIMKPPTKAPQLGEGNLIDSLSNIPSKMKKLHEERPDKNELMNELLTALDRVKVAIYKLQPLTAKMNAIYRKSVGSNTRDIIMDSNKGTYAKRYPPGDYDDSYARIPVKDYMKRRSDNQTDKPQLIERRMGQVQFDDDDEMLTSASEVHSILNPPMRSTMNQSTQSDTLNLSESQIIATSIGQRLDGPMSGELKILKTSIEALSDDDQPNEELSTTVMRQGVENVPMFGYRVTIFHTPESADDTEADQSDSDTIINTSEENPADTMVTSESSLVKTSSSPAYSVNTTLEDPTNLNIKYGEEDLSSDTMDAQASGKKRMKKKKNEEKGESNEKKGQEKEKNNKDIKKKQMEHKKMNEEESKRKKEYKKVKHNKGVISKEKKTMKRDKQVKAHDRGAAKEKALKERTQIEFFEREQIVDDEFEKGKKSIMKAGWQSGHDAKKTKKDLSGDGDSMSLGGSHYVKHAAMGPHHSEKGQAKSEEITSAKKSNKIEKKEIDSKGKKFKGWREKGYKIITETEFIDRGSLHDSAYKKRDKGASQHHKFKKHEASSEGHQGSMHEHMKKTNKKEEKKSKMQEKKEKHSKKDEEEKKKMEKQGKEKKDKDDQDSGASDVLPTLIKPVEGSRAEMKVSRDLKNESGNQRSSTSNQIKSKANDNEAKRKETSPNTTRTIQASRPEQRKATHRPTTVKEFEQLRAKPPNFQPTISQNGISLARMIRLGPLVRPEQYSPSSRLIDDRFMSDGSRIFGDDITGVVGPIPTNIHDHIQYQQSNLYTSEAMDDAIASHPQVIEPRFDPNGIQTSHEGLSNHLNIGDRKLDSFKLLLSQLINQQQQIY